MTEGGNENQFDQISLIRSNAREKQHNEKIGRMRKQKTV